MAPFPTACTPSLGAEGLPCPRCTWARLPTTDPARPEVGEYVCAPDGHLQVGEACTEASAAGPNYDDCVEDAVCVDGVCKQACDLSEYGLRCDASNACTIESDVFVFNGFALRGVCEPACDPLTQSVALGPRPTACGSPTPDAPTLGCYGNGRNDSEFSCAPVPDGVGLERTDRATPLADASGNAYLNGCSPGFAPFFYEETGATRALCAGFCAALETDNTPAHANNGKGDPNALAKLPTQAMPTVGDGTCDIGKKGSEASSQCRFVWTYLLQSDGTLPYAFEHSPLRDTLGVCIAIDHFTYDANGDMTPDTPYPDCATLPPHSNATPGEFDDASDWGCQKYTNTPHALARRNALGIRAAMEPAQLARHELESGER
ncbi:MAG TPA: hypothetical protein VGM90_21405 [Kofleriaceae bacterium]